MVFIVVPSTWSVDIVCQQPMERLVSRMAIIIISVNKLFVLLVEGACMTLVLLIVFKHSTHDAVVMHEILFWSSHILLPASPHFLICSTWKLFCVTCIFN